MQGNVVILCAGFYRMETIFMWIIDDFSVVPFCGRLAHCVDGLNIFD